MLKTQHLSIAAIIGLGIAAGFSCAKSSGKANTRQSDKPNILFIAVDDLRPELGCFGNKLISSPNIDKLASKGVLFTRAYCNVPVCGASRASLLTGARPGNKRFIDFSTRADQDLPEAVTLPGHFRNHGYATISLSKVFHEFGDSREAWDVEWRPSGIGSWRNYLTRDNLALDTSMNRGMPFEVANVPDNAYFDGQTALNAIKHLRNFSESGQPFFLAVGFLKPHLPFNAPKKYWDIYDPAEIGLADNPFRSKNAPDQAFHNFGELRNYSGIPKTGALSDSMANTLRHGYYACVSYTDAQIGLLMDELKKTGLDKNTIVVLWGDHGWNLGEHGLWCKHCNFNTSLHAPLIFKVPGVTKGKKNASITEFIDIYPTLCELAGLPLPLHLEGESLTGRLKKPGKHEQDFAVCKYRNGITLIENNLFYTEWYDKSLRSVANMLYDHTVDPDENTNLSTNPEFSVKAIEMSNRLKEKRGNKFF